MAETMEFDPRPRRSFASERARIAAQAMAHGLIIAPPELWAYEECCAAWLRKPEHCELLRAFVNGDQRVLDLAMDYVATIFPKVSPPQYTPEMQNPRTPSQVSVARPFRKIVTD